MKKLLFVILLSIFTIGISQAQNYKYIGASKCKMCHNKPEQGQQYTTWLENKHSHAMETLKTDRAKEVGAKMNIHDPVTSPTCISCHSTFGHVDGKLISGLNITEGVSCESCHGPGSMYKGASVMKNRDLALDKGMILPTEEVCKQCHNSKSPTFKGFNYEEAIKQIDHSNPLLK